MEKLHLCDYMEKRKSIIQQGDKIVTQGFTAKDILSGTKLVYPLKKKGR